MGETEQNDQLVGASVWEQEMYSYLTDHVRREGAMLREYLDAAEETKSKAMAYLINMLANDERRHHQFINDLASSLRTDAEFRNEDPAIPRLDLDQADGGHILALTKRLLDNEKEDLKEMKRLRKELRSVEDTTLWTVIVDTILADTEKHIGILEFALDHAKHRR